MRLLCALLFFAFLTNARAVADVPSFQWRCEYAYRSGDPKRIILACSAAAQSYATIATRDAKYWHWAGLYLEGIDLVNVSIAQNSAGQLANARATAAKSQSLFGEVRSHCPLNAMRKLANEALWRLNALIELFSPVSSRT